MKVKVKPKKVAKPKNRKNDGTIPLVGSVEKKHQHIDGGTISYIEFGYMSPYMQIISDVLRRESTHDEIPHVIL